MDPGFGSDGGAGSGFSGLLTGAFGVLFVGAVILVLAGFVTVIVLTVHRARVARREGFDPVAGDIQLMGTARRSALMAPAQGTPLPQRLATLDALLAAGSISRDEHAQQRARILGQL
jgi:hypothetical protein